MSKTSSYSIEMSGSARHALREIHAYIAAQGAPLAAENMVARILVAIEGLAYFPLRGRAIGRSRELTTVSPYIVRYRIAGSVIRITRIRHAARKPS